MSTLADYSQRIDVATNELEAEVASIKGFSGNLSTAVTQAQTAAQEAQTGVDDLLALKPLFKGEYGQVEEFTTRITLSTQQELENNFGTVFKAKVGCTGISIDAVPGQDIEGWHCYVRNESSVSISVTSSAGTVDVPVIAAGQFARIILNSARDGFEVISYSTEGSESPVRFESVISSQSTVNQFCTVANTPKVLVFGVSPVGGAGDQLQYDGAGTFTANSAGQYLIYASANIGRSSGNGTGRVKIGALLNGVPTSNPRYIRMAADTIVPFSATFNVNVSATDTIQFYIEDEGGTLDIGVIAENNTPASPSCHVEFGQITGAIISGGGGGGNFDWSAIPEATQILKGLMSAEDKTKLDGLAVYSVATEAEDGLLSSIDKAKLNTVEEGAQTNVNADWNASSGDALILNKPSTVDKGQLVFDPVTETSVWQNGTDGFMEWEDKVALDELKTIDVSTYLTDAPSDGKQYARQSGNWTEVAGGGGGGGASTLDFADVINAGLPSGFDPVSETTSYSRHITISNASDWELAKKSPEWLMQRVWGTADVTQIDYKYREVCCYIRNSYNPSEGQEKAPWGASPYNWVVFKVTPYMYRETNQTAFSTRGSNAVIECTYISNSFADVRTNGAVSAYQNGVNSTEPRKYINFTLASDSGGNTGTNLPVYYKFPWREMSYGAVTPHW